MRVGQTWVAVLGLTLLWACGSGAEERASDKDKSSGAVEPAAAALTAADLRVQLGDCAGGDVTFESGPRPMAFDERTLGELAAARPRGAAAVPDGEPASAAAPAPNGTGTAMPAQEGKMGRKESSREAGRFARPDPVKVKVQGAGGKNGDSPMVSITSAGDFSSGLDDQSILGGAPSAGKGSSTAWGAPGPGRYGTISHGGGTGLGYGPSNIGRGRMPVQNVPRMRVRGISVEGELERNIVRRYVRRKRGRLMHCYTEALVATPRLQGLLTASFQILANGKVSKLEASGVSDAVSSCVGKVLSSITFPKPEGGGMAKVRVPLIFQAPIVDQKPNSKGLSARALGRYEPGQANPMGPHKAALATCFAAQSAQRYAAAVLEVELGKDGRVSSSKVHGVKDPAAAACIAKAAEKASWPKASGLRRCSLALGRQAPADALGVDLDATELRYAGKGFGEIKALAAESSEAWKIAKLFEFSRAELESRRTLKQVSAVDVTGPVILRPVHSTPMKVVLRVYRTLAASNRDPVLTAQDGASWRSVRGVALPVVPVPRGSGARWGTRLQGVGRSALQEPPVRISVLLTADDVWVGISSGERVQLALENGAVSPAKLLEALAKLAKSRPLSNPGHVELSAEDTVSYGTMVGVIDAVHGAYPRWQLLDPSSLTVRFRE